MSDDREDLLQAQRRQIQAFQTNVGTLGQGQNAHSPLLNEWNAIKDNLTKALPRLGPAVQLAAQSMVALVSGCLASVPHTEQNAQFAPQMRSVWISLITAQIVELEKLLANPPDVVSNAAAPDARVAADASDRKEATALLTEAAEAAAARETSIRRSGFWALAVGIGVVIGAAAIPFLFFFSSDTHTTGWALTAAWATRLLAIAVLIVAVVHLLNVFRDMMGRAAAASRERALLRVLAASSYLGNGKDHAAALIELVRALSATAPESHKDSSLVLPASLVKELPDIIKLFKSSP